MKTGILTLLHQVNYGGVLQAYATQQACRKLGCDADLIDYRFRCNPNQALEDVAEWNSLRSWFRRMFLCGFAESASVRRRLTRSFMRDYMEIDHRVCHAVSDIASLADYDRILVGSDQVWNPYFFPRPNPYLLQNFFVGTKSSYASSIGVDDIPENRLDEYVSALREFRFISVRERTAADIVERLIGRRPPEVLDPTLLLTDAEWRQSLNLPTEEDGSVFCYWLGPVKELVPLLQDICIRRKQTVKLVMFWPESTSLRAAAKRIYARMFVALHPRVKVLFGAGPLEFLSALSSSSFVLGSSFHSLMFATVFKKKTRIFLNTSASAMTRSSRIVDFCARHGLESVVSQDVPHSFPGVGDEGFVPIDVDLSEERVRSLQVLKEAVS